jgi:4-alpha-glucanotransferase
MANCPWGVESGYEDAADCWHDTPPETRTALLAAMGVTDPDARPPAREPVRVLRPGPQAAWAEPGEILLEEGGHVRVDGARPVDLPLGYHRFQPDNAEAQTLLIVSPGQCVLPSQPMWGWAAQLYATRSAESWGMGDLADLERLGRWAAAQHAGMLLINPINAAPPVVTQEPSPYYPCSRQFFNPLYLRVEEVPGAAGLGPALERLAAEGRALNRDPLLDRKAVFRLKQQALRAIFTQFRGDAEFDAYCHQRGVPLQRFAAYCALAERYEPDWRTWPAEFHDPDSPAVRRFMEAHRDELRYHQWQQWLVDRQLARAATALPIVQDLPIGFDPGGADAWSWQSLLARRCTMGAPPDVFNMAGQDWQLPPFVPHRLRQAGYEPMIHTIRAALRHAGGLRIDHVMGLFRLYWIPEGFGPQRGGYVRYRPEEMLAIVALESQRAGAFVVGEDLGTVGPEVRQQLAEHQVLSFRLLWFEKQPASRFPRLAMAATTTHDLPTVAGLWTGCDMAEQRSQGNPDDALFQLRAHLAKLIGKSDNASPADVIEATYRVLGQAPSLVLLATLEDALAVTQRPNVPGTTAPQRPNWSLALPGGLEALETSPLPLRIAQALARRNNK